MEESKRKEWEKNVLCLYSKHKLPFKVRMKKTECIFVVNKTVKIKIYVNNVKFSVRIKREVAIWHRTDGQQNSHSSQTVKQKYDKQHFTWL